MHLNERPNGTLDKLFTESSVVTPAGKGRGEHGPAHLGKDTKTMIIVDPLRKGNGRCPLSVSLGRGGKFIGRGPRAGTIHRE